MRTLKLTILLLLMSTIFMQQLPAQIFTTPYQAVNYQRVISNGLNFDGVDDYISVTRPVADDFTIEFWMKTTQTGATGPYWYYGIGLVDAEYPGGANDYGTALVGNKLAFGIGNPDFTILSNTVMNDGIWKHVAVTRTKATGAVKIYINGVLDNSNTAGNTGSLTAPTDIKIGKIQTSTNYFNGSLDDIRIWNYERTAAQISANMNNELSGSESGLVIYYNCNQGTPNATNTGLTTIYNEVSASNYNGVLYNFALTGQTSNWVVGKLEPLVPTNSLKLYVDLAKPRSYAGTGSTLTDLSPSGNNMTLYNSPYYYSDNGGNLLFNGINNYSVSNAVSTLTGASPRTVCVWYYPTSITNAVGSLFWTGVNNVSNNAFGIGFSGGKYQFWGMNNDVTDATLAPTANSWNFIAAAYGGGTSVYQYLNGTGNLNSIASTLSTPAGGFVFSKDGNGFTGKLGSIMIYNRVLSKLELDKIYNNMKLRLQDGSSAQNAAVSGMQLHLDYPTLPSGWYWIKSPSMPNALQMYVDMTEDGGGYDFYPITAGPSACYITDINGGTALGLDIVYPRSKYHWRAMSNAVNAIINAGKNGLGSYTSFFQTAYGIYRSSYAINGNGNYTAKILRSAEYGGTTNAPDWQVKDGGMWWLRDAVHSEPNGDYNNNGFLGIQAAGYTMPTSYSLTDIGFNDGGAYCTGNYYLVSTNAKKGVVYDNTMLLYVDPNVAGSYSSGTTVSDLSANLNNGTLSSATYVNTTTTPKKFTFNGTASSYTSFTSSKFNTTYTGKTVMIAAKMDASFGTNLYRCLFGSSGSSRNFNFYIYQNGTSYQMHLSTGGVGALSDALTLVTGQWYVFTATQDASAIRFYLNGILVGTTTGVTLSQYLSTTSENIGLSDNYWYGEIGTTMIYKRALSASEIQQNVNAIRSFYY